MVKTCSKCLIKKDKVEFCRNRWGKDGLRSHCKLCTRAADKVKYHVNREQRRAIKLEYYHNNKEVCKHRMQTYKKENPGKINAATNKRRAIKREATPSWVDPDAVKSIYIEAHRLGKHVDHIIPLNSPTVCGLHWEGNLQLLDPLENLRKGNRN